MPRFASFACAVLLTTAPFGAAVAHATDSTDSTVATTVPVTDSTYVYDLEVNPVGGAMVKLISGLFTVAGEVTR